MLEGLAFLASYYSGGEIGNLLSQWEQIGFFSYILPFLLLFALIFGLLTKMKMFDNKGVNGIIALVVSLMALQFEVVPRFFAEIFPRFGVGLSVILVAIILLGIFIPKKQSWPVYLFLTVGFVAFVAIFFTSFDAMGWGIGDEFTYFVQDLNWGWVLAIVVIIVGLLTVLQIKAPKEKSPAVSKFTEELFGG